jgi:hypothetical protein
MTDHMDERLCIPSEWRLIARDKITRDVDNTVEKLQTKDAEVVSKRKKISRTQKAILPDMPAGSTQDVCKTIINCIQDTDACDEFDPSDICNESVLSIRPYKEILENHFGDQSMKPPSIPIISKSYEEMFMREPFDVGERPCVMGDKCECKLMDPCNGFIAIEFSLPGSFCFVMKLFCHVSGSLWLLR